MHSQQQKYLNQYKHYKQKYVQLKRAQYGGQYSGQYNDQYGGAEPTVQRLSIEELYKGIDCPWGISSYTNGPGGSTGGPVYTSHGLTYGEMTETGVKQMLEGLDTNDKIFYDLGSGFGRVVINALRNHNFAKTIGVEIVPDRNGCALQARNKLPDSEKNRIEFVEGDILQRDISDADIIWISNLCFEKDLMDKTTNKLAAETKPDTVIFCSQAFNHPSLQDAGKKSVEMTWSAKSDIYQYKKV